jgi:transcription antitermination factor NusG
MWDKERYLPARLPQGLIDELHERESPDGVIRFEIKRRRRFKIGQSVRMRQGPFAQFVGNVVELSGPMRVKVLFAMFGRQTPVIVAETDLAA